MKLQHVNVKIFVDGDRAVDPSRLIEVFHDWIRESVLDELLVDVADYRHVPAGPGVVLVGHEADYALDHRGGRWGLLYNRKAAVEGANADRFAQALRSAARACELLETRFSAEEPLRFSRREFELFINDRALAPNTPETLAACRGEMESFLAGAFGHDDFTIAHQDADPRRRFAVGIQLARPFELSALLAATV